MYGMITSEIMHIFCCVLPTLFSLMSLLAGIGIISTMPGFVNYMHDVIHSYEVPIISASGVLLSLGWILYLYAKKLNCSEENTNCCHEPCTPKKYRTKIIMIIATVLFAINVSIYFGFHSTNYTNIYNDYEHRHSHSHSHSK